MPEHRTTLQDIAKAVGKSNMTVSLALRDHPKISLKTRTEIYATAQRMGYRTDPVIAKLMNHLRTNKTRQLQHTLAYLNHHPNQNIRQYLKDVDSFFNQAKEQALQLGYKLEEFWTHEPGLNAARLSQILYSRGIEGVIVGPTTLDTPELKLDWRLFSSITLGYSIVKPDLHRVLTNRHENTLLALQTLKRKGYKHIGCAISADLDHLVHNSYSSATHIYNLDLPCDEKAALFRPQQWNKANFIKWVKKAKPDVIFGAPDCVSWLNSEGIRVPEDIAFAMEIDHRWSVDFSGTRSNLDQIGKVAINFLIDQVNRGEKGVPPHPLAVYIKGVWHEGATTPREIR